MLALLGAVVVGTLMRKPLPGTQALTLVRE
ncbi:hypothetical protein PF70_04890 [Pseudomonas asplenii]|nr:hypothetical protein PF70_04890 [Pseudomonas fuscovaginae]